MGTNEIRLCGSSHISLHEQLSSNGLQVKFCSDNKYTARGFNLLAYKVDPTSLPSQLDKREIKAEVSDLYYVASKGYSITNIMTS